MNNAILQLVRRAEANDPATLVNTFVDAGSLFTILSSLDHQVMYGRRGTGKTHVLQYLAQSVRAQGDMVAYVDMRTIGSSGGIYADPSIPLTERGTRLLADTMSHVYNTLQNEMLEASYESDADFTAAMTHLDRLGDALTDVRVTGDHEVEAKTSTVGRTANEGGVNLSLSDSPSATLNFKSTASHEDSTNLRSAARGPIRHRVHFGAISQTVGALVTALPGRLWVLMDEWSDVPMDLQPLLADLLRRSLMVVNGVTVKVAAIEQRSNFIEMDGNVGYIGFELGPDIAADVDLDDFMVFGNDSSKAAAFFRELFYRHVRLEFPELEGGPRNAEAFVREAFTQINAFDELVRAAEGVPRDAINIIRIAAQTADDDLLSVPIVRGAARKWYLRDKDRPINSNPAARALLHWVIDEVIGARRARAFLLRQDEGTDSLINALYDARVLHVIKRGVAAHDQPGIRFDVYALDYGCYVELISTARAPEGLFSVLSEEEESEDEAYVEVPADDYRSIRRAILQLKDFRASGRA